MCQVQTTFDFEYVNENGINDALKCSICSKPLWHPIVLVGCGHKLCLSGVEIVKKSRECPRCKGFNPDEDWHPVTGDLLNQLDQIQVKCKYCNQTDIQRGNFDTHISETCPKVPERCTETFRGVICTWKGSRDRISSHRSECNIRAVSNAHQLYENYTKQIKELTTRIPECHLDGVSIPPNIEELHSQANKLHQTCSEVHNQYKRMNSETNRITEKARNMESQITDLKAQRDSFESQIKSLSESNKALLLDLQTTRQMGLEKDQLINELEQEAKKLASELVSSKACCEDLKQNLNSSKATVEEAKREVKCLTNENTQLQSDVKSLTTLCNKLDLRAENLRTEKEQVELQYKNLSDRHQRLVVDEFEQKKKGRVDLKAGSIQKLHPKRVSKKTTNRSQSCVSGATCAIS